MELALVGDGAAREQQVRLKLHFEDRSILSAEQLQDGLADSWFLVACHLRSISDLASHIIVAFGLVNSCPHGIFLSMENFTLPPCQSVWLLKDKDIVSVNKKIISADAVLQQVKHVHSSSFHSFDKITPLGVKANALEEFERETGGYESEQEEENDALEARQKAKAPKTSSTKLKKKKRKREKIERDDQQDLTKLQVVPYTGGLTREKEKGKKSKKQRLIMQQDDNETRDKVKDKKSNKQTLVIQQNDNEKVCQADKMQECAKDKNVQEPESSNAIKIKKKKKKQLMTGDVSLEQPSIQKRHALKGSSKSVSLSTSDSSSNEKAEDEERKSGLPVEGESVKKQSRSTLRKKAKRRWRREHGELAKQLSDKLGDASKKAAAAEQPSLNFKSKHEDDGDAEEERLPRVVRPGHVRFEPLDEDDDDGLHSQHPLPLLDWSNGISKRKGQSWGQEKAKRGSKNLKVIDNMEICDTQELKFEALPALEGTPQNGDVIAYRILELTSSFCPELSEYRVGKVVDLESQSGALKLAEVPNYPLRRRQCDYDAETNEDVHFSSLYDKEGFLETQISSLSDIRLVEGSSRETCKSPSTTKVLTELATTDNDINLNTSTVDNPVLAELARTDNDTNLNTSTVETQMDVDKTCNTNPNTSKVHVPTEENSSAPCQGWPELFEVIERKKQELGNKEDVMSSGAADLDKPKSENGCSSTGNNSKKDARTGRAKGWHKKAGGLGATMALLRSQNVQ